MLGSVLLVGCVLFGQVEATADDGLELKVRRLVRQLDSPQLAHRDAAEEALLKLGPKVLDLLPQPTPQMPAGVRQHLDRIRQKLQRVVAESAATASLITLSGEAVPLSRIFAALEEQSGNKIVLRQEAADAKLSVDFHNTPFWQALDQTLDQAGLTLSPFVDEQQIEVIERDQSELPRTGRACYGGPFRFEPVLIAARRDLRNPGAHWLGLTVEVAWEPRLKPISLKQRMSELEAVDENGDPLAVDDSRAELEVPAAGAALVRLPIPMKLPPREVKQIARLKGRLTAMIPGKVETFRFGDLTDAKNVEKRIAGVVVTLHGVRKNNELWEVRMSARFDEAGETLQSHYGWIFNNEVYLEDPDGKQIPFDSMETTRQASNAVGIAYLFVLDGPPNKHTFVYKTPGAIVATGFDYEIKGVKLP